MWKVYTRPTSASDFWLFSLSLRLCHWKAKRVFIPINQSNWGHFCSRYPPFWIQNCLKHAKNAIFWEIVEKRYDLNVMVEISQNDLKILKVSLESRSHRILNFNKNNIPVSSFCFGTLKKPCHQINDSGLVFLCQKWVRTVVDSNLRRGK
jgi:hypothetical protein